MFPRPLKVFLCHIMPVGYAHADRDPVPQGDDMRGLYARLTQVSNGLCHGLTDKSGLINPRMYNCHTQAKVRSNP